MKNQRNRAGFTMAEVLLTLAILAVLAAVAIPGVLALRTQLKMMELNDTAREIFLAAQNTLTARRAAGTLSAPQGDADGGFYWLSQDNDDYLLPTGAIGALTDGCQYQIKYNPVSATVLEVYYAESPLPADLRDGGYSNDAVLRRQKQIGYYNGGDLEGGSIEQILPPQLFLINEEELYVRIVVPSPGQYAGKVALTLTVEELDKNGQPVPGRSEVFSGNDTKFDAITGELRLVLDSLNGPHFKDRCPSITPGADIRVTARLEPTDADTGDLLPAEARDEDNSLFALRTPGVLTDRVDIAYPRHLQNLDSAHSGIKDCTLDAVQTSVINWATAKDSDGSQLGFQSITNDGLRSYDGRSLEIQELRGENGLFERFDNGELSNIYLADPRIDGRESHTGALAGSLSEVTVSNCRVYADALADKSGVSAVSGNAGGLIGQASDCEISNSFAALPLLKGIANYIGGLVGQSQNCSYHNCYAVVDDLSGGSNGTTGMFIGQVGVGTVTNCYAVGNISAGRFLYGFTSGGGTISSSYCAVTYETADGSNMTPIYGFAEAISITNCAYLDTGFPNLPDKALAMSYDKMTAPGWTPGGSWINIPANQSHPYRQELFGKAYPFPGLRTAISRIPHYGSWPVQTVDAILAFHDKVNPDPEQPEQTVSYLVCPTGGTISFWAEPRNGGEPVDLRTNEPSVPFASHGTAAGLSAALGPVESDSVRTQIVLHGTAPGVYAVEVTAGGARLWVPVIVCSAEMTLTGKADEDGLTAVNSATLLGGQPTSTVLPLRTTKGAGFSAALAVTDLNYETAAGGVKALYTAAAGKNAPVSTGATKLTFTAEEWLGFRVVQNGRTEQFGPGVSLNEEVANGVYRLQPVNGSALYRSATNGSAPGASDTLTVTGQSAGMATVSVCWAMDSRLNVNGHIEVTGTQAAIHSAAAYGSVTGDLGSKGNFPYMLDIKPIPKETVTLSFTGWLSSRAPDDATQTWEWIVKDSDGREVGRTEETFAPGTLSFGALSSHDFAVPLDDDAPHARYEVQLVYSYTTSTRSTYTTSDFMYVTVARTTLHTGDDAHSTLTVTPAALSLEQVTWGDEGVSAPSGHERENLKRGEVRGTIDLAADTQLLWYLQADAYNSRQMLTGMDRNEPVIVYGPGNLPIAKLLWTAGGVGDPPGGVVTVEAINCDYYGNEPLTFHLLAQARDNGENADRKEVPVHIMPKLKIDPQSRVVLPKKSSTGEFSANRTDRKYSYSWSYSTVGGTPNPVNGSTTVNIPAALDNGKNGKYIVSLQYGPYTATAQLMTRVWGQKALTTAINEDGVISGGTEDIGYFLVKKGETRQLEYSWSGKQAGNSDPYGIYQHPSSKNDTRFTLTNPDGTTEFPIIPSSSGGSYAYQVTGNEFATKIPLEWGMSGKGNTHLPPSIGCYVYVVGIEFDQTEIVFSELGQQETVHLLSYFPNELNLGNASLKITSSNPNILSLSKTEVSSVSAKEPITFTALNYGTTVITATHTFGADTPDDPTDDRVYQDTCTVTVQAPDQQIRTVLEPCTEDDRAALAKLFGISPDDELMVYADYGGEGAPRFLPTLLTGREAQGQNFFGHDVLYLKTYITDRDGGDALPLTNYVDDMALFSDNPALIDIYSGHDAPDAAAPYVFYLKVQARPGMGTLLGDDITISAQFGSLKAEEFPIKVFREPSVIIRWENEDDPVSGFRRGQDVTNLHTVIQGFDKDTALRSYHFHAELYPWLTSTPEPDAPKLDELFWYLKFPSDAYDSSSFIGCDLSDGGRECDVTIKASPNCKVAITVQSKRAYDAGETDLTVSAHALVFIPKAPDTP